MTSTATVPAGSAAAVAGAVETVESHLHPNPSYDLADHPVPHGREEVWRFTPMKRIGGLFAEDGSGVLQWQAQLPDGATLTTISAAQARELAVEAPIDRVSALAVARSDQAQLLEIAANAELSDPVDLSFVGSGDQVWGQTVIRVGENASATIVVRHTGAGMLGAKTDVVVGEGANVTLVSINDWSDDAVHGGHTAVVVGRDARLRTVQVSLGGDVVRVAETARFAGPGGELEQFGLYFVDAGQHIEHRLFVDHNQPHTRSNVDYRGGLQGDGAHSVWVGDVLIRKVAEGIETYEANKNLVLTDGCQADSVPNLEIETGEILGAGHSSTTGRFDDEQLFYLMSRGVTAEEAKRLVVRGFFAAIVGRIGLPDVEAQLIAAVDAELAKSVAA